MVVPLYHCRCRLVNLEVGVSLVANSCNQVPSYSHLTSTGCEFIFFLCQAAFLAMKSTGGKLLVFQSGNFLFNFLFHLLLPFTLS